MKTSGTNRRIRVLMRALREETLVPRPEFQRRLVWTNRHKENFLTTVLMNYPFPEIYVASGPVNTDTGEGSEMLVDGQQRITTLHQYFTGSEDLKCRAIRPYASLTTEEKLAFLEYEVVVRDLGSRSIEEIREVFQRINSTQYSLNAMEIHNARFDGALKKFSEDLAAHNFFSSNNVFRTNEVRRMGDLRFCLTLIISVMSGYFNRDDLLEDFLARYNEEFEIAEELREEFDLVFEVMRKCRFGSKSRVWRKADLLTLIIEIHAAVIRKRQVLAVNRLAAGLKNFYRTVDGVKDNKTEDEDASVYHTAALQATNDRVNRVRRAEIIARVIEASQDK